MADQTTREPRTEAGKALALRLSRHALFADEAVSAIEEQATTEADLRLLVMTTARDAAVVEADRLREAATEARRELDVDVLMLTNEAARAVTEPRRFHENEGNRQQALGQAVAAVRLAQDRVPPIGDPDAWLAVAEDLESAVTGSNPSEFRRNSVEAKHYAAAAIRRRLIEEPDRV